MGLLRPEETRWECALTCAMHVMVVVVYGTAWDVYQTSDSSELSSMPGRVGGGAEGAGEVEIELHEEVVLGVSGGVP